MRRRVLFAIAVALVAPHSSTQAITELEGSQLKQCVPFFNHARSACLLTSRTRTATVRRNIDAMKIEVEKLMI